MNIKKLLVIVFFVVIYFILLLNFALALVEVEDPEATVFTPQIEIPGSGYQPGTEVEIKPDTFADYLTTFYNWAVGAIIVIGIVMIMFAGFQWVMAAGSAPKISAAKERIFSAIIGILLAVGSYALLNFINPSLTRLRGLTLETVAPQQGELFISGKCGSEGENLPSCLGACRGIQTGGIKSWQCQDASLILSLFFGCLTRNKEDYIKSWELIITSISDDRGLARCRDSYDSKICSHEENSAHYGGGTKMDGSYAADFRCIVEKGQIPKKKFKNLVEKCGGKFLDECGGNNSQKHYHVSVYNTRVEDIDGAVDESASGPKKCTTAVNEEQCQNVGEICQWRNSKCGVKPKCGLTTLEIKTAEGYVRCCCKDMAAGPCKYATSPEKIEIGSSACAISCQGAENGTYINEMGTYMCDQFPPNP